MKTRNEAIEWLNERGNYGFEWDVCGKGAFGVATAVEIVEMDGEDTNHILGKLILIYPIGNHWEVRTAFDKPPTPLFKTLIFYNLEQAVRAAADLVSQ